MSRSSATVRLLAAAAGALAALAPAAARAEGGAGAKSVVAMASAPIRPRDARRDFEAAMAEITADLPDLVVTSKLRTDADQERLLEQGYRPHPNSQHKHGLAWDVAGPEETLDTLVERARARGFVPLKMRSPVSGRIYLHVQRYRRSPASAAGTLVAAALPDAAAPAADEPVFDPAAFVGPPEPTPEELAALAAAAAAAELALRVPRPVGETRLSLPPRLRRKPASGRIVLLLDLDAEGRVAGARIEDSDLPAFEDVVLAQVKDWRFSPFTEAGQPIAAQARLPIPISIR